MTGQIPTTRFAAIFSVVIRPQTYSNILYVLVAIPLGTIYLLLVIGALVLDLVLLGVRTIWLSLNALLWLLKSILRLVLRVGTTLIRWPKQLLVGVVHFTRRSRRLTRPPQTFVQPHVDHRREIVGRRWQPAAIAWGRIKQVSAWWHWWIVVTALCWRLAVWERNLTVRWLHINIPTIERPKRGATGGVPSEPFPWPILGYLLAKLPFGVLGAALAYLMLVALGGLLMSAYLTSSLSSGARSTPLPSLFLVVFVAVPTIAIIALHALDTLVNLWGRFTYAMLGMNDTVRRLREASARAAQEHAKAERAEQSRRDLIINVGHELRTPIASICAHIESITLALDEPSRPSMSADALRSNLQIVQRESEQLGRLVDELLAFARSETDAWHLNIAPIDTAGVIDEVHQALAPLARHERQVTLVREVSPGLPLLLADRQRLVQVLLNLVRNAITYTPVGGIVSLTLQRADHDHLMLAVADTGSGIAPTDLDRIFERFYRTDTSRTKDSGGFGLGLAIVRELVEAMGGTITVESTLGEGSCFAVRLPVASQNVA